MLVYVFIEPTNYPTSAVATSDVTTFIFCTFLQITSELKEIAYYSKLPIGLLSHAHALSHETVKNFIANVLNA